MSLSARLHPTQPAEPSHLAPALWPITLAGLALTLLWDAAGLDVWVMTQWGTAQGFALQHNWWLETVLHQWARVLAWVVLAALALMVWRPLGGFRRLPRRQRLEMLLGVLLALVLISTAKHMSLTSCPWDLQQFGGAAQYRSHWAWGVPDGGAGQCFPGGHASAALAFLAVPLSLLATNDAGHRRAGWLGLAAVLLAGLLLGGAQTLRGAHYPSHTLWTGLMCWSAALLNHRVWQLRRKKDVLSPP